MRSTQTVRVESPQGGVLEVSIKIKQESTYTHALVLDVKYVCDGDVSDVAKVKVML